MKYYILLALSLFVFKGYSQFPGCPQITPTGASICQGACGNLNATVITNKTTNTYAVSSIPYTPFAATGGTAISVGTDDIWSSVVNLGFNFCFFGNTYSQMILGSNGQICFNTALANGSDGYVVNTVLPSSGNTPGNTINVFRDINPATGGATIEYYIAGSAPCRYLVFYFTNVALFSCTTPRSTFQMVLYENTNYIDIYVGNSSGTCSWQSGNGIIGIQNAGATVAYCPPGRNGTNWTAVNEGWRFSPTGAPSYAVTWKGPGNVTVGTGLGPISVCPTASTTYTAIMAVTNCDGAVTNYSNTAVVTVNNSPTVTIAPTGTLNCSGTTAISTTVTPTSSYVWSGPGIVSNGTTGTPNVNQSGVYTVTATAAGCTRTANITMVAPVPITLTANSPGICLGSAASLTGSGASTYTWLPGGSTANPFSVSPTVQTTYTVMGTSVSGCTGTATSTVSIDPNPSATLSFTNPNCGNTNGVIVINNTSSGGQTITNFGSSAGTVSGQTVNGLGAGSPVITLTNNFGCTYTVSATLSSSPGPSGITTSPTNATCGNTNGSFTFGSPTGGVGPYTYAVNGGAYTAVSPATGLAPGTYSISVKDANGCIFTKTIAITNIPGPTAITGATTLAGCSLSNGTYNITGVTGGTAAYTYSVDGISTASLTSGLSAGAHTILVRDVNGCTFSTSFNISTTPGPTSATVTTTNASCGSANGTSAITGVTGGAPTYNYSFDGGSFTTGTTATGLAAGAHNIIIKDINTCTLSVPYSVLNNGSPTISLTSSVNVLCNGVPTGSLTTVTSGGSGGPYTYTLTNPFQTNGNGQFTNLAAGIYTVIGKDATGCVTSLTVSITQPAPLTLALASIAVKCYGTATGTVNVTGTGGMGAYQYQLNGTGFQASNTFSAVAAGTPIIQIKDANGCTATETVTVTQPTALAVSLSTQNANCTSANGVASSTVTGGTPPYIYAWTGGAGSGAITNSVVSGTYSLTITDSKGCIISNAATIANTPGGTAAITGSTNITCNGANNGILTANMVTAGTAPFTYSWTPGGQVTSTATGLAPGTYTCKITDFYGCIATTVGNLTQPSPLTAIMNSNNVKCYGTSTGTVSAAGTGGTGPYTYLWATLASTLSTVNNVAINNYTCQIKDANNCIINPTIAVTQPSSITLISSVTPANCNQANGSVTVTPSGGTPAYTYTWSAGSNTNVQTSVSAGTYTINVKDANNCTYTVAATVPNLSGPSITITSFTNVSCFGGNNGVAISSGTGGAGTLTYHWDVGPITPTATNLLAGVHTVSVTDQSGCIASASVNISQPTILTVSITPNNPKCFGSTNGNGVGNAFGGTPAYTYTWTGGGGGSPTSGPLGAGSYGLNVTDSKGCVASATMALVNPPAMSANITSTNVTCFNSCNGTAIGTTTNNVGIVTYYWIGGASPVTAQTITGLCASNYTLTATDQNSCTASAQVIITQPAQITASISSTGSVTCNGGTNGSAQVTAGGGTGLYTYVWTGAAVSAGNSANANNLPAGTYSVNVTDQNGCSASTQATILQPAPLATTLTTTNPKCFGSADGIGNVAFTGGSGATTFLWGPGLQSGPSVNNLTAGNQSVTITYNGACTSVLTFTLTQPTALTAAVTASNSNCGHNNGITDGTVGGGTAPYTYLWSNGTTTLNNPNVLANAYTFTVTDANLCKAVVSALVNDIAGPSVAVTSTTAVKCFGGNDGTATTSITGGVTPYAIAWSANSATVQNVSNFTAGINNIVVTDAAGCIGTAGVNITQPTALVSAINTHTDVTCFGLTNGQALMQVTGGTTAYTYSWTPSAQTSSVMANVGANTYTCNVKDANNCTTSKVVTITEPQALVMAASSFSNISCFGGNNGQISTTVQGGTPGYVYTWIPSQTNSGVLGGLSAGGYSLTVTDSHTCSINANFSILEPSALTSSYISSPAKCGVANGSATVTVHFGAPSYTINWNTPGLQQGTVGTGMGPGSNWHATITDSNGCTITQAITIADAQGPQITGALIVTPPSCSNTQDGSITINYTLGTPGYTVSWSNPINPATQVTSSMSQTVTGIGAGAYSATVTDTYGCKDDRSVTVIAPGPLVWTPITSPSICLGQSAQISANGFGGTPAITYTWTPGTGFGNTSGPYTVNPAVTTLYNVNMSDANHCTASPTLVTVYVSAPLSVIASATTICQGDEVTLTPTVTSTGRGVSYITYAWSNNAATDAINVTGNSVTSPNHYTVTVNDGCTSPSASAVFTVIANGLPTVNFTGGANGCAPWPLTFTGTTSATSSSFLWTSGESSGSTSPTWSTMYNDSGKYSVSLTVTDLSTGCHNTSNMKDYVTVYPKPIASFVPNPQSTSILDPLINFTNTSQGAATYLWDFGDPAATGGMNNATTFNAIHSYNYVSSYNVNLVATSNHGCLAVALMTVEITPDFALYIPNTFTPDGNNVNDFFQPSGVGINEDNYRMDIFDRWGENIFTSNNFKKGWDGSVKGSGKIAEQGVYIYKLMIFDMQGVKHPFVGHVTVLRSN